MEEAFYSENQNKIVFIIIAALFILGSLTDSSVKVGGIDDWQYEEESGVISRLFGAFSSPMMSFSGASAPESLGFSTGGAKDINNLRRNIENNYLPLPTDITYEGLFYDYYFDMGKEECQELFCPSYSYALTRDPFSGKEEHYMAVGLNSGIKASDFERKKLNLVIVLDISGSMSSTFSSYYYDKFGKRVEIEEADDSEKSKMKIAAEAVVELLDHLNDDDRFGMVLFESQAHLAKPLRLVGETDMQVIKDHILEINPRGGTRMSAGMQMGTELFEGLLGADQTKYENRIIFLTDAMPNLGETSESGLLGMTKKNAESNIHTTFIGIGVDFNTELVENITKIRGANYYSVHSSKQFKERMDEGFDFMVTPLVFNLKLKLEAQGFEIEKVFGSPEANEATGELMKVNTLFPSKTTEEGTKGGLVLLKLKKVSDDTSLKLKVSYEDRKGNLRGSERVVVLEKKEPEFFENNGIRKGVLLTRYASLIKNWINDERSSLSTGRPIEPCMNREMGIVLPCPVELGRWERQSASLTVSDNYRSLFNEFAAYFEKEMDSIGDETLNQELDILNKLGNYA